MVLNRRFLILAGVLVLASAAYGAITTDRLIIKGGKSNVPGIVTNAPISARYVPTVLTGSYTVAPLRGDYSGKVFIVRGTTATTVTLPQPSAALAGYRYTFINDVNQTLTLSCSPNKIYCDNGTNSWVGNTASVANTDRRRGVVITVLCTGEYWYVETISPTAPLTRT